MKRRTFLHGLLVLSAFGATAKYARAEPLKTPETPPCEDNTCPGCKGEHFHYKDGGVGWCGYKHRANCPVGRMRPLVGILLHQICEKCGHLEVVERYPYQLANGKMAEGFHLLTDCPRCVKIFKAQGSDYGKTIVEAGVEALPWQGAEAYRASYERLHRKLGNMWSDSRVLLVRSELVVEGGVTRAIILSWVRDQSPRLAERGFEYVGSFRYGKS